MNPPCTFEGDIKILQRRDSINKILTSPVVSIYTKKVPLLALGRSRRPGTASQLRLAPPKRLTMEKEEKNSDEYGTGASESDVSVDSELE